MVDTRPPRIAVSVGICAYNEAQNIGILLEALMDQRTEVADLREILVVASGCTDETPDIVRSMAEGDDRIKLIEEPRREGKASAVNEVLQVATGEVVVLESADTVPERSTVEALVAPFIDPKVGVVGARPVPTDDRATFWGGVVHALWALHHEVSLRAPKTGEMFAFRPAIDAIPGDVGADEDWIRNRVESLGYEVRYAAGALVYNAGPKTLDEYLKQRVRIGIQEVYQRRRSDFVTPTWRPSVLANAALGYLKGMNVDVKAFLAFLLLEAMARAYSVLRVSLRPVDLRVWESLPSTKSVTRGDHG